MKCYVALVMIFLALSAEAQEGFRPVDRDQVKKAVSDGQAATGYKQLLSRFEAFDATLTQEDFRLLYYGFVFQGGFSAYPEEHKKEINQALNDNDLNKAIGFCDEVLKKYPISLAANYYKGLAIFRADTSNKDYIKYRDRYRGLVDAILSSGDGLTCETGYRVISVSDEYMIIYTRFKVEEFKGQALVSHCDRLTVKPSEAWPKEQVYFDATEILKKEADLFGH